MYEHNSKKIIQHPGFVFSCLSRFVPFDQAVCFVVSSEELVKENPKEVEVRDPFFCLLSTGRLLIILKVGLTLKLGDLNSNLGLTKGIVLRG